MRWVPLLQVNNPKPSKEISAARASVDPQLIADEEARTTYHINDIYQVARIVHGDLVQLNIRRRDGKPIFRDWRHFQAIKNDLLGPECEAVELYPAESRLVDSTNKYHLWGVPDPTFRWPFGYPDRDVRDDQGAKAAGLKQRKL